MSRSLAKATDSMPLNSIEPRMAKASMDVNRAQTSLDFDLGDQAVSLFFDTLAAIAMPEKEAAYQMALDPATLSRIKNRQQKLPFEAMWRMPDRFWIEFSARINAAKALTAENANKVRAARIGELVRLLVEAS